MSSLASERNERMLYWIFLKAETLQFLSVGTKAPSGCVNLLRLFFGRTVSDSISSYRRSAEPVPVR